MRLVRDLAVGSHLSVLNCLYQPEKLNIGEKNMKTFKAICLAAILALALSVPAYAGEMHTPGYTPPPPPPPPESSITETSFDLGDLSTTSVEGILWVLASMF